MTPSPQIDALDDVLDHPVPSLTILEIGFRPEQRHRHRPLVATGRAHLVGIEADPLAIAARNIPGSPHHWVRAILGDGQPGTLHITRDPACTSLLEPDPDLADAFTSLGSSAPSGRYHVQEKLPVQTTRLDDITPLPAPDLIRIDIQGAELAALEHGPSSLEHALIIDCAAAFVPLYRHQPLFGDMQRFLADQGFLFHKFLDIGGRALKPMRLANPHAPISQMLWADAIFVRDFTRLDRLSDRQLLKLAALLHQIYQSMDLALLVLREHDRRNGGHLGHSYGRYLATPRAPSPLYLTRQES